MNDVFRQVYTPLTDEQKALAMSVKIKAQELWDMYDSAVKASPSETARLIAVAKTNLEQSVMWAVKGITS